MRCATRSARSTTAAAFAREQSNLQQTVAELPGFTRGLAFLGDLAFVGLSQVRETAVFSGIPVEVVAV